MSKKRPTSSDLRSDVKKINTDITQLRDTDDVSRGLEATSALTDHETVTQLNTTGHNMIEITTMNGIESKKETTAVIDTAITSPSQAAAVRPIVSPQNSESSSPPASPPSCVRPIGLPSPTNRDKFMAGLYVQSIGCCLDACTAAPNARLHFKGTIVVLYPMMMNPDRRYVFFKDEHGTLGITIWKDNNNLKKIDISSIGKLCEISKVSLSSHQGKKVLNLSKESEVCNM
jgi:hypothetical protein